MRDFIQHQQRMIDQSNRDEFTVGAAKRAGAARIDAKELDLGTRMQLNVAHNTSGPLERSTVVADASSLPKQSLTKADAEAGLVQRVRGLESHLGLASGLLGS
ncbi:hypothetical protein HK105_204862 [Polyrhizophydium stewartii]|uniref:Uncharacterized protein n=1 Tax=Polyrhizophydium stewartii TaxID=2732419 RepID=A0ABR4N819_9FUNG